MNYPPSMDKECIPLCDALNLLPGVTTIESCCGHSKDNFNVFFTVDSLKALGSLVQFFESCHSGQPYWKVCVYGLCDNEIAYFVIRGPIGEPGYESSKTIATKIIEHLEA